MQSAPLAKRLVDNWPMGMAVALMLALLPLVNWFGLAFAVLMVLRHGGVVPSIGYALVAFAAYFAATGYSFQLIGHDWLGMIVLYFPLWVMAITLRLLRSLSLSLAAGAFSLMAGIGLMCLVKGPPTLEAWIAYFQCRMQVTGMTQAQLEQILPPGMHLSDIAHSLMIGWPLSVSLMQVGMLLLARWMQARFYYPGGFRMDFRSLCQPKAVALLCGALLLATSFAPENMVVLINLGTVALVLMGISGLGFVHAYVAAKQWNPWWLALVYLMLVLSTWSALMLLSLVALVDSGIHLRTKVR